MPKKTVKYYCYPGFHFWGQEIAICDPDLGGWQIEDPPQCLVDVALNKVAFAPKLKRNPGLLRIIEPQKTTNDINKPLNGQWVTKHRGM